ncbi:hypothetical protein GCM10009854_46770 [Saccharopolyspora halophila]|uniref:Zinc-finger n=1 Tax=Saccharopolyspora halophila TaxID=405551 RepID=A0ABN3GUY3_9PSEU
MPADPALPRHFWLPIPAGDQNSGKRHAFRGRRWEGERSGTTVCAEEVPMARPSEMDWITLPTCLNCYEILRKEQD